MVDTKCNFPNGKYKNSECSATNSSVPDEDESLLRQPMQTSCVGFWEAKKAYENGTDEVRRLLMQECSLIYECNVCRNMFRSLANFISHKRNYCKMKFADNFHSFPERNASVIIQTVERPNPWLAKSRSTGSSPIPGTKSSSRDLSKVIERLKRVEVTSDSGNNIFNFAMENKMKPSSPEPKAPDPVLELELVSTTTNAVYQTLKTQNDSDSIKTELDEVHNLLTNQKTLLGPDGKAIINPTMITSFILPTSSDNNDQNDNNYKVTNSLSTISCEVCKLPFQTEKTLKMHVQKKHTSTTYVFQCPTCSMTFLQPAAVIRHLANEHKKPLRRIRKMRDTILKKRIQIGDVQVKGPSRELKRLKLDNTKDFDDSNSGDQQNEKPVTSCTYCCKNFERRAVLATHLTNCLARKKTLEKKKISEESKKLNFSNEAVEVNECKKNHSENSYLLCNNQNPDIKSTKIYNTLNIKQEPQDEENSSTNNSNINELFESLESQTFGNGLKTLSLEKLEIMVKSKENNTDEVVKVKPNEKRSVMKKEKAKRFRIVPAAKQLTCRCKICNKQFNALSNLRRHISMFHYRSRRFGCSLCEYRAFRRYDIVNHLTFVHKLTGERESMAVEYVTVHEMKYSKYDVDGDIVVVNEGAIVVEKSKKQEEEDKRLISESEPQIQETPLKTYEKREKRKNLLLQTDTDHVQLPTVDTPTTKEVSHVKVVRRKLKKTMEQKVESQKRPIRNRIKTVNKDFVYDLLTIKEEPKQQSRLALKRRNTIIVDQKNVKIDALTPPIKITPYLLRTEPLIPADKNCIKGHAANVYRNAVHEGLASPSTLPEMPTERPQMRSRLISSSRSDSNTVPVIETTELEAARLKSTFFDDSFLEKFAKTSNPSFKMKPLLALQHSPLNSILQKFDTTQQQNNQNNSIIRTDDGDVNFIKPTEKVITATTNITSISSLQTPMVLSQQEINITPNGKQIAEPPSPPSTPKKRITLMQRLVENRAKRKDSLIRAALEN